MLTYAFQILDVARGSMYFNEYAILLNRYKSRTYYIYKKLHAFYLSFCKLKLLDRKY